jgi:hypothetical protein
MDDNEEKLSNSTEIAHEEALPEKRISWWRRNPRTVSLLLLLSVPVSIVTVVVAAPFIPAVAGLSAAALLSASYFSSAAITGLAIKEWVHKGAQEEQQKSEGIFGRMVAWMRKNPKYTKAIAIPVTITAIGAGVASGGIFLGIATATLFSVGCYAGAFGAGIVAEYVLPKKQQDLPENAEKEQNKSNSFLNKVKETMKEHRILTGIGICLFAGAVVFSGGLALGLTPIVVAVPAISLAASVAGIYSVNVLKKDDQPNKIASSIDEASNSKKDRIAEEKPKEIMVDTIKSTKHVDKLKERSKVDYQKSNQLSF